MAKEENKLRIKSNVEKRNQQISKDKKIKKIDITKNFKARKNIFIKNYFKIIQPDVLLLKKKFKNLK